jgi:hypothetical protein
MFQASCRQEMMDWNWGKNACKCEDLFELVKNVEFGALALSECKSCCWLWVSMGCVE